MEVLENGGVGSGRCIYSEGGRGGREMAEDER